MTHRPHPGTERSLAAPVLHFSLLEEIHRLKGEPDWTNGKRAITLTKEGGQCVVLIALEAGASMDEHLVVGALTVQLLEGRIRLDAGGDTWTLAPGELLALEAGLPHDVHAFEASAFLLTLTQPAER